MGMMSTLRQLRRTDKQRPGVPGEHWAAFGTALAVLQWARGRRSGPLRMLGMTTSAVLAARALSGRDGPLARWRTARPSR